MIVIPMAGLSSRFFKAGYTVPKYQLDLHGESVFTWSVKSFQNYFQTDFFLFICRDIYDTKSFIEKEIKALNIVNYKIVCLENETLGQADTVYRGLKILNKSSDDLYIFNIDSKRVNYKKPELVHHCDGYLEVFYGEGDHWSFVEPYGKDDVIRTTEKDRISNLCSDGLYYFKDINHFLKVVEDAISNKKLVKNELYIAPLYNDLIQSGYKVKFDVVADNEILFCGTPEEYKKLLEK